MRMSTALILLATVLAVPGRSQADAIDLAHAVVVAPTASTARRQRRCACSSRRSGRGPASAGR